MHNSSLTFLWDILGFSPCLKSFHGNCYPTSLMFHSHLNISALNTAIKLLFISITTAVKNAKESLIVWHSVTQPQKVPIVSSTICCYEIYLISLYCRETIDLAPSKSPCVICCSTTGNEGTFAGRWDYLFSSYTSTLWHKSIGSLWELLLWAYIKPYS